MCHFETEGSKRVPTLERSQPHDDLLRATIARHDLLLPLASRLLTTDSSAVAIEAPTPYVYHRCKHSQDDYDITRPHLGGSTQSAVVAPQKWVQHSDSVKRKIPLFSPGGGSGAPNTHKTLTVPYSRAALDNCGCWLTCRWCRSGPAGANQRTSEPSTTGKK